MEIGTVAWRGLISRLFLFLVEAVLWLYAVEVFGQPARENPMVVVYVQLSVEAKVGYRMLVMVEIDVS